MSAVYNDNFERTGEITCDGQDCSAVAPPLDPAAHPEGLIGLGWYCSGGLHYCTHCSAEMAGNLSLELEPEPEVVAGHEGNEALIERGYEQVQKPA